ncbi:RnfABCDGE type electron transport complex subunit D [Entomospira nematocerorum]|uniref:RnfABCDGE type electron transport complex subunit D n=1 Tax=Entomospira nematocerorum TaxID=2719987 RepID=A0A968GBU8_9SPIO|nr:RnfABCDGE type electron transport complex subunit D [Entomospira nematocera]NIZ46389.1 RnfABCDGE type electron transport complex subunit D [Entomospira nematocera]WDI33807.1 RnfABCDGE type electron transport complex subunit D [Entomospira nematocera]
MIQTLSIAPYIRTWRRTWLLMFIVALTLMPHVISSYLIHGGLVFHHLLVFVAFSLGWELLMNAFYRKWTLLDGSALLTGVILAFITPLNVDLVIISQLTFFAIIVAKWMLGGLGLNYINPAMFALLIGLLVWPLQIEPLRAGDMSVWSGIVFTPEQSINELAGYQLWSLGAYSSIIILASLLILGLTGILRWEVTISYLISYGIFSYFFLGFDYWYESVIGVVTPMNLLIAVYIINNPSCLPSTFIGGIIKGIAVALLLGILQKQGGYTLLLVPIAVLLGDILVPIIDRYTQGRSFSKMRIGGK